VKDQGLALQFTARVGQSQLDFDGRAADVTHWDRVQGQFILKGPSLAEVGAPLGLTLPTTGAFLARGQLQQRDKVWDTVLDALELGSSHLSAQLRLDMNGPLPQLSGSLSGANLNLRDLGPAVGTPPVSTPGRNKVLPHRPLDLASLRAMQADVEISLREVDLNTPRLEPLRPFNARLILSQGVLVLEQLDARITQGQLRGTLALDGQQERAHWVAELQWDGVSLQQWVHQPRSKGLPAYVSGTLQGHASLQGYGRSTAEMLATLQGRVFSTVQGGTLSHLLVEAAGLHLAETLGIYFQGDQALPLDCAVADLQLSQGRLRPSLLVLDTSDSTLWLDGTLSLAEETLDLRAVVAPKDISLLSLRAPLQITGSFAQPRVAVAKGPLGSSLASALLLGLLNPLAAWIPLVDLGNREDAQRYAQDCRAHLQTKVRRGNKTGAAP
jgi:uncharacterized protein involved in outer membrane biogenesis